ncbi:hypothetical protein [Kineothrix sp. MSJ-39]|uniref:hypothetical protein n=1 Tax=Kineothrix sp. MSJ-39 TaxID=2841533 RepID=UPI003FA55A66
MKPDLKNYIQKLGKLGKDRFILLFLAGILLIIIAMPLPQEKQGSKQNATKKQTAADQSAGGNETGSAAGETEMTTMQYGAYLQKQLETFLSSVDGVGKVKVCLTMQASKELVPAHNTPYTRKSEEEMDENGKRTLTETQNDAQIILYEQADGSQSPLIIRQIEPTVRGVVVAAQGAGSPKVQNEIVELLEALFGIEAHKIKIVKLTT